MAEGMAPSRANTFLNNEYGSCYCQLHTGAPGAAGTSNVSAGADGRRSVTMNSASGGQATLNNMGGDWENQGTTETISHISLWTASSSGTFLRSVELNVAKQWADSDTMALSALAISVSPLAS